MLSGTLRKAARVEMMITGSVISARVNPPTSGEERGTPKKLM